MNHGFGSELPHAHSLTPRRQPARYLVVIDSGGSTVVRLFLDTREAAGEFDAGTEEVALMTRGLAPAMGASGREWDRALEGHSAVERAGAEIFTLDV